MVYWKYIENYKQNCEQVHGGNWQSDNICMLLHGLFCDKGPIRVEEHCHEEENHSHCAWSYHIYMENGDYARLQCVSRKIYDKIHNDVMKLDGKKLWFNGTFIIYETVKR